VKSKRQKQLEAQYRLLTSSMRLLQTQLEQAGRSEFDNYKSFKEARNSLQVDLAEKRALRDRIDFILRAEGFWYTEGRIRTFLFNKDEHEHLMVEQSAPHNKLP